MKKTISVYGLITLCSLLYGLGISLFIFPSGIVLGGTGGISVILARFVPITAGGISTALNGALIVIGYLVLGKELAMRTIWGSATTMAFIYLVEIIFDGVLPFGVNAVWSAVIGGGMVAVATGLLFTLNSSSGGTDIIALILAKRVHVSVAVGLLIADVLTVLVGGFLEPSVMLPSVVGFAVKVGGVEIFTRLARRFILK